ncbi:uncharacterized protein EDB91DRAFT_1159301 [Suillus paluster]|uniref:uncharacterized protein n=1 Tax=Suillus paluster TaxID=48578 RepID=UPI001B87513D|nr:uncharacterized protein EDB91DRAFT_1159301 [Suillus paluster]KAG1729674.1 hypothetical protein EDB91DRAFT_1159301 [Suillus paluster]
MTREGSDVFVDKYKAAQSHNVKTDQVLRSLGSIAVRVIDQLTNALLFFAQGCNRSHLVRWIRCCWDILLHDRWTWYSSDPHEWVLCLDTLHRKSRCSGRGHRQCIAAPYHDIICCIPASGDIPTMPSPPYSWLPHNDSFQLCRRGHSPSHSRRNTRYSSRNMRSCCGILCSYLSIHASHYLFRNTEMQMMLHFPLPSHSLAGQDSVRFSKPFLLHRLFCFDPDEASSLLSEIWTSLSSG